VSLDVFDLEPIRADGWFERVVASVPALARLCEGLGEGFVALSLVAGFRIVSASVDRTSGEVTTLQWVREGDDTNATDSGTADALRSEVMAALLGDADDLIELTANPSPDELRDYIGVRYVLLAPLFGFTLAQLEIVPGDDYRVFVQHERGTEAVGLRQFRRFLRSRVIDSLQQSRARSVAIDLEQVEVALSDFRAGRYDQVIERLGPWVAPLLMYLRTPEGAALDMKTRADLGRSLGILGEALHHVGRSEEGEETLRLGIQYAHDGSAAGELYRTLARLLIATERRAESIGLIRRALTLDPSVRDLVPDLALGFLAVGRGVAAIGVLRELRNEGVSNVTVEQVQQEIEAQFGDDFRRLEAVGLAEK
jgi:tetratricopeptide (TPR) repeat protein